METIAEYVKETMNAFYAADENDPDAFLSTLRTAADTCHAAVVERGRASGHAAAATTLTLYVAVWPARVELRRGDAILLCTDGLTKHVTDERIAAHLGSGKSAEHVARALVDEALAGGGTDNVTVLVVAGVRRS